MPSDTETDRLHSRLPERSEKYDRKLADILATAAQVFARDGFDQSSIRRVAEKAGVSVAGLYYYVRSKEELLYLIQFHVFDGLVKRFREDSLEMTDPAQKLELFIRNHLERFLADMSALIVCSRELGRLNGEFLEAVESRQREYFSQALGIFQELEREHRGARVEPRTATLAMFGSINWVSTWYHRASGLSAAQLARDLVALYLRGVIPSGSPEVGSPEVGSPEVGSLEVGSPEVGSPEVGSPEVGSPEVGSPEVGSPEVGSPEVGSPEVGSPEVGSPEVGSPEVGSPEVGSPEAVSPEAVSSEVGSPEGMEDGNQ